MEDEALKEQYHKAAYRKGHTSGFAMAVADYFKAPTVEEVDLSNYSGAENEPIRIVAVDDFQVAEVDVEVLDGDNQVLESGVAVQEDPLTWIYTTQQNLGLVAGNQIRAIAKDLPGNVGELVQEVPEND